MVKIQRDKRGDYFIEYSGPVESLYDDGGATHFIYFSKELFHKLIEEGQQHIIDEELGKIGH